MLDAEAIAVYEASINAQDELGVGVLGSGSDYTIFLQRIGVRKCLLLMLFDVTIATFCKRIA